MSDETPWSHLQRLFAEARRFEDALPGLLEHGLNGDDLGVLLNNPSSDLVTWARAGWGEEPVSLSAVEPPAEASLPPRRSGRRGLFGWLGGANVIEGLGLFTESDVFEFRGAQFAVLSEPLRPVVYGALVPVRVLALNCTSVPLTLTVGIEAERGVVQSPRRYVLSLEPGVISLAVLPVRVCPSTSAVVPLLPTFDAEDVTTARRVTFSARPYARPAQQLLSVVAGASLVAAAAGLSPVYLQSSGPANQGSPDAIRLRPDLSQPIVAPQQAPVMWRLMALF